LCRDTVNRGLPCADGDQADATLVALNAKDGSVVWTAKNGDPAKGETGTPAPHVIKDKVIVGISGGEFGVRGSVTAYDIKTSLRVWHGYSMGPDSDTLIDPEKTTSPRQTGGRGFQHQDLGRRSRVRGSLRFEEVSLSN
jgi:lanthanide-dependent methanol dehydrogenase